MQLLGDILPDRTGSLLSINSLREDLEVSHRAVSNWLNILESFYYFKEKLQIPFCYQVIKKTNVDSFIKNVRVVSADRFLGGLT
jgi:predicted AAA+ superfamily ATPase